MYVGGTSNEMVMVMVMLIAIALHSIGLDHLGWFLS